MSAAKKNIHIEQGATFKLQFTIVNSAGTALVLTGYTGRGQIRKNHQTTALTADFTFSIENATAGIIQIALTSTQTEAITISPQYKYVYDIEIINSSDEVFRVVEGYVIVSPNVTRASSSSSSSSSG